jgi:carboxypeptidase PM20D1
MRRALLVTAAALAVLAGVVLLRAARFESKQLAVKPAPPVEVDASGVARRLAGGLRIPTVSYYDRSSMDERVFLRFHRYLRDTYPVLHGALERERVAAASLLYTWRGRRSDLRPVLLLAHQDVVPVEAGTEGDWTQPPFGGRIDGRFVWGRGAMDNKGSLFCILEAVETLVAAGFEPERTVMLAFGDDEEIGGDSGALAIADLLRSRGVELESVLDEGGAIAVEVLPNVAPPIALIGIAEKGSATVELRVDAAGGHSSTPPRHTAVGLVSRGITALESHPMRGSIGGATELLFQYLGPELAFPYRVALANLWLFRGVLERALTRQPTTDAMLRTTTAATVIQGGVKENVLPVRAWAAVNFRILPGDSVDDVVRHVRATVADERVRVELSRRPVPRNPSAISPVDSDSFRALQRTIDEVFPGAIVAPYLVLGGTDARHYGELTRNLYRFAPFVYTRDDRRRIHGSDERIAVDKLPDAVRFYMRFIRSTSGG